MNQLNIAKAKRYAEKPERIQFTRFEASSKVKMCHTTISNDGWQCTCRSSRWATAAYMAMRVYLGGNIQLPSSRFPAGSILPRSLTNKTTCLLS